jgi:hypothetical protein
MRIKKFNESTDEEGFDIEYINQCFAELSDDFRVNTGTLTDDGVDLFILTVELPKLNGRISFGDVKDEFRKSLGLEHSLSDLIKNSEDLTKILKLCDISVRRLSDEYPNYKIGVNHIDDKLKTRINYMTKTDTSQPYLSIIISK